MDASVVREPIASDVAHRSDVANKNGVHGAVNPRRVRHHIEPRSGWRALDVKELWQYRELLWLLAMRDIQLRYKQTALGAAWAVLQPLLNMLVFTVFFGYLGGMNQRVEHGIAYPLYTFTALLPWQLFAFSLTQASGSVVANRGLLTKVYFPRLLIPMVGLPCAMLDFAVSMLVLFVLMAWYGNVPGLAVLLLPIFVLFALLTSLAVGMWLAALNAIYRDVQYTVPFLTQLWLFLTPVAYPSSIVPLRWQWLYGLNPMAGVVEGFRWALIGGHPPGQMILVSAIATVILLSGGLLYFRRMEQIFADIV